MSSVKELKPSKLPGLRLSVVAFVVSFGGSFNFGYQLVLTNPSQDAFLIFINQSLSVHHDWQLSETSLNALWSLIVALLFLGCLLGSVLLPLVIDNIGRKNGLYVSTGLQMLACFLSILSKTMNLMELYTIARFVFGIALGLALGTSSIYLSEISPKRCRGVIGMSTGVLLQTGLVVAAVVAMPLIFGSEHKWHLLYAIELFPLSVLIISLPFLHESPSFLVSQKRSEEALKAIIKLHGCSEREAKLELAEIHQVQQRQTGTTLSLIGVLRNADSRRGTLVGCTVAVGLGFTGIVVINAFAVQILQSAGLSTVDAAMCNVGLGLVSIVASIGSSLVIDRCGRRPILLALNSTLIMVNLAVFGLMRMFEISGEQWIGLTLVGVIAVHVLAFSMGPGPIAFFITAEMVGSNARSAAQGWTSIAQMTCRTVILAVYLPFQQVLGAFAYLILFVAPLAVAALILYFYLPETKNRNVEEVRHVIVNLPKLTTISAKMSNVSLALRAQRRRLSESTRTSSAVNVAVDDHLAVADRLPRIRRISRSFGDISPLSDGHL